ncbi:MAG TPA: VWA domain-containing protein, partial [Nannocystaceae bacterium]|nr:VWA domain-containing protein [Nannocystaceae bacterium]
MHSRRHRSVVLALGLLAVSAGACMKRAQRGSYSPAAVGGMAMEPGMMVAADGDAAEAGESMNTEEYLPIVENEFITVADDPLSTFSIDVDTAAYSNVRRFLHDGELPPASAVRLEELVNYFDYAYDEPEGEHPFSVDAELAACPWNDEHLLVHVGLQGKTIASERVPARNLVFLLDVSGSMNEPDKLPLLKHALGLLAKQLRAEDRVSIVVYAGASGLVLEPTNDRRKIERALARLEAGGSTNGAQGIELAYQIARKSFVKGGINRVLLASDGDFNVGVTDLGELVKMIETERESGVALTVLGFGRGNLGDATMEQLADHGNGNYSYIDGPREAEKVLMREVDSTLVTIAKDVKIQVEFNPAEVAEYRLIGYENRMLAREDFNNDKVDAGDIGAGHRITALYEIVPAGTSGRIDPLRYAAAQPSIIAGHGEIANVRLRYKLPDGDTS